MVFGDIFGKMLFGRPVYDWEDLQELGVSVSDFEKWRQQFSN